MADTTGPGKGQGLEPPIDPAAAMATAAETAENLTEAQTLAQKAWSLFMERRAKDGGAIDPDPFNVMDALTALQKRLIEKPETLVEASIDMWQRQAMLWTNAIAGMAGVEVGPAPGLENADKDRRFKDDAWESNAVFTYLKQTYLIAADTLREAVHKVDADIDPDARAKLDFFTERFIETISPSNVFTMNPQVLQATIDENGANIVRGMRQLVKDLERGKGDLAITQTDMDAFQVGENIAVTPGKVIFRNELFELIQYAPSTAKVYERPLLIVPPWINKFYIMDLNEKKSLVRWLAAQGYTVFMMSWRNPEPNDADHDFSDYLGTGFYEAARAVKEETGQETINVAGYCIGGTLLSTGLAHMAALGDDTANSATFFTAQADFVKAGDLKIFVDDKMLESMEDEAAKQGGVIGAQQMAQSFNMLRGNELIWNYVVSNYYLGKEPTPFDLLYWNADSTRMPAKCHISYLRDFYRDNALSEGELEMFGEVLDLRKVKLPVYSVCAKEDHIAPAESVFRSVKKFGGPVRFVVGGSGHIAGIINPPDPEKVKYQYWTSDKPKGKWPESVAEWLEDAEETPGSWWPDWDRWLSKRSGKKIKAREPGATLGVIEDAPGSYVKVRSLDG